MTTKRPLPLNGNQHEETQPKSPKLNDYDDSNHESTTTTIHPSEREIPNTPSPEDNFSPKHDNFPTSLNSIKEFITTQGEDHYLPLMSTINLKKRRRMLYLPLEFGEITLDGLVDSGAYINAISWSDYTMIRNNTENCIIKEYPQPPFKIECANATIEQPIATADMQFNIGSYTFTDTFVVLSRTSFPLVGLNFMRNHQAVLDTANGTITFPHIEMTLAMKDEMKKFTPQTMQVRTNETQTIPSQQASTINAIVITNAEHTMTGTIQPLPQFDENAQIIVAPAITSTNSKRVKIRAINTTESPYTISTNTKIAEMQILTPEDTKHIRPIDVAALKIFEDHDDAVAYVQELMKTDDHHEDSFWFPTPENPGNENEHTPIQQRVIKEIRELEEKEKLNPTTDQQSREKFLNMFQFTRTNH